MSMLAFEQKRIRMLFHDSTKGFYFITLILSAVAYWSVFVDVCFCLMLAIINVYFTKQHW